MRRRGMLVASTLFTVVAGCGSPKVEGLTVRQMSGTLTAQIVQFNHNQTAEAAAVNRTATALVPFDRATSTAAAAQERRSIPVTLTEVAAQDTAAAQPTDTSVPTGYSVATSGGMLGVQTVGVPFTAALDVKNTGQDISHLVVDIGGCIDHWVLDDFSSNKGQGTKSAVGDYYDFGLLFAGGKLKLQLTLDPKNAGNHDCDIAIYRDIDSSTGIPSGDPVATLQESVAINPAP